MGTGTARAVCATLWHTCTVLSQAEAHYADSQARLRSAASEVAALRANFNEAEGAAQVPRGPVIHAVVLKAQSHP
jgi:hypothetical protein